MISKTGIHALAALAALARLGAGAYAGSGDIAREIGAPRNYLGKLLKTLADAGFLESQKGKGGGFRMARDPATIPLINVIGKIERIDRWSDCLMGRGRCSDTNPCPAHERWAKVREAYLDFLESTSIADLAAGGRWASEKQDSAIGKTKGPRKNKV